MILGFMKRFPDKTETEFKSKILDCYSHFKFNKFPKLHTVRTDQHKRWNAGMKIHFCTGVRTKQMDNFAMGVCKSVQEIEIWYCQKNDDNMLMSISIDDKELGFKESERLAINDGFSDVVKFLEYFRPEARYRDGYPVYRGRLIHWTDLKY